jgi:hypothetical protein
LTAPRLLAIVFIYCCTAVAWSTLGASVVARTGESDARLAAEVAKLWGGRHDQIAPDASVARPRTETREIEQKDDQGRLVMRKVTNTVVDRVPVALDSTRVSVSMDLDQRQKGLLWYNTYGVRFKGDYRVHNPDDVERALLVHFTFPSSDAIYDGFVFEVNGREAPATTDLSHGIVTEVRVPPRGELPIGVAYRSRGLGDWTYAFAPSGVSQVHDLELEMKTDFDRIDFPAGTLSPTAKTRNGAGWTLTWRFGSLVSGQSIGMAPPSHLNPGPLAARITFFAPVSLLFFMTVLVILGVLEGQSLHPMNYFFLAAAFFSFHLLLAYLVDHWDIHAAFLTASATSIFLVVTYLRIVGGVRFALARAGLAQLVFLVLFSYAFFFEGYTGLTVTVGAIVTLFVLMQVTARVNWTETFAGREPSSRPARAGGTDEERARSQRP